MLKGLTLVGDIFLLLLYPPSSTVAKQSAEAAAKPAAQVMLTQSSLSVCRLGELCDALVKLQCVRE